MSVKQRIAVAAATAIAIPAEGLRQWAYYDPPGILSVCYGSTTNVQKDVFYSREECERRLSVDMLAAVAAADRCAPDAPWQVLAAFGDAVYNLGPTIACNRVQSTAARLLHAQLYAQACAQLPRWDKARVLGVMVSLPGLTSRREKERLLCVSAFTPTLGVAG